MEEKKAINKSDATQLATTSQKIKQESLNATNSNQNEPPEIVEVKIKDIIHEEEKRNMSDDFSTPNKLRESKPQNNSSPQIQEEEAAQTPIVQPKENKKSVQEFREVKSQNEYTHLIENNSQPLASQGNSANNGSKKINAKFAEFLIAEKQRKFQRVPRVYGKRVAQTIKCPNCQKEKRSKLKYDCTGNQWCACITLCFFGLYPFCCVPFCIKKCYNQNAKKRKMNETQVEIRNKIHKGIKIKKVDESSESQMSYSAIHQFSKLRVQQKEESTQEDVNQKKDELFKCKKPHIQDPLIGYNKYQLEDESRETKVKYQELKLNLVEFDKEKDEINLQKDELEEFENNLDEQLQILSSEIYFISDQNQKILKEIEYLEKDIKLINDHLDVEEKQNENRYNTDIFEKELKVMQAKKGISIISLQEKTTLDVQIDYVRNEITQNKVVKLKFMKLLSQDFPMLYKYEDPKTFLIEYFLNKVLENVLYNPIVIVSFDQEAFSTIPIINKYCGDLRENERGIDNSNRESQIKIFNLLSINKYSQDIDDCMKSLKMIYQLCSQVKNDYDQYQRNHKLKQIIDKIGKDNYLVPTLKAFIQQNVIIIFLLPVNDSVLQNLEFLTLMNKFNKLKLCYC